MLFLSQRDRSRFHYTAHSCRDTRTAHLSNLCYRDVLLQWKVKDSDVGVFEGGICLVGQSHASIPPFNRHNNRKVVDDFFLHFDDMSHVSTSASIFRDKTCPNAGIVGS